MLNCPRIMVCSDLSEASDRALKMAGGIAKKSNGEILLVHIAEIGFYLNCIGSRVRPEEVDKKFSELIQTELLQRLDEQMKKCGVKGKTTVSFDSNASKGIARAIDEYKIDFLVMGDKGAGGLDDFLLGSLARKMAASATIPVLIVKNETMPEKIAALVSTDENVSGIINSSQEFSYLMSSELSVISLLPQESMMSQAVDKIKESLVGDNAKVMVKAASKTDFVQELVDMLQDKGIQLAILRKHHKAWMQKFLLGSVSGRVLELYKGNVLVLPEKL